MPDVNILVYAHRGETKEHERYATWFSKLVEGAEPFALSELVLSAFVRIVTNPRIFRPASTIAQAFEFIAQASDRETACLVRPEEQHWLIFQELCRSLKLSGKLVADAYHAALAIEHGCEWISADTDFARFQQWLRWRHL